MAVNGKTNPILDIERVVIFDTGTSAFVMDTNTTNVSDYIHKFHLADLTFRLCTR